MRFAIVESGGKQYRAVEGSTIDVDRLALEPGKKFNLERVLLMADADAFMVGTPDVSGIQVAATVLEHFKGPKVVSFKYRPKKRIRVKGGHRHHYTRLMIDFIGKPGEERTHAPHASAGEVEKPAVKKVEKAEAEKAPKAEKQVKGPKKEAEKSAAKKTGKKSTASKSSSKPAAKKTDSKKK